MFDEHEGDEGAAGQNGFVVRAAERLARRDFLKRSGLALGATVTGFLLGASPAMAGHCGPFTGPCSGRTVCNGKQCVWWQSGYTCTPNPGMGCCSGGYCWTEGCISCCDWYGDNGDCACCINVC